MTPDTIVQLLTVLGGPGLLFGLFTIRDKRRQLRADAEKTGVDATAVLTGEALDMVREARDQAKEARLESQACRREIAALRHHVDTLEQLIRDMGGTPPPLTVSYSPNAEKP